MKMLLTTIKSENHASELELRYLYSIVADAPFTTAMKMYDELTLDLEIFDAIVRGQYNIVYFHIDENNERRIRTIAEMVKKAMPSSVIIAGGIQVSFDSKNFMAHNPCIDYLIRGEGETVLFNFLRTLITYEFDFANIAGLVYRDEDAIIVNPYDTFPALEDLPFPYDKTEIYDTGEVYYETIRGTADRSIYAQHYPDARVRSLSLNRVCTELRYFLVKRVGKIVFLDTYFNYNIERAYRIFEYIINNDNGITSFEMNIDGDKIDDETIRLLSEAREGLFTFNIDVASTNAETLAASGLRENIYQLMYNINRLMQSAKVDIKLSVTAGLPLETEQLFARSFNKVYGLAEGNAVSIKSLRVKRGALLREEAGKYGYIYCSETPYEVIATAMMPAIELIEIKSLSKVVRAFSGNEFKLSIPRLMTDTSMKPYEFFRKLSEYIFDNNLTSKLLSVESKYRIIYAFAVSLYEEINDSLKLQIFAETLHQDLENNLSSDAVRKFERRGWELETW
ncbi:MAG: DUF4080 domain-containing protein [Clostridiales bacterium]|nr:DUF4080 domain-containing protein [Candidatus Crickella caballi]